MPLYGLLFVQTIQRMLRDLQQVTLSQKETQYGAYVESFSVDIARIIPSHIGKNLYFLCKTVKKLSCMMAFLGAKRSI